AEHRLKQRECRSAVGDPRWGGLTKSLRLESTKSASSPHRGAREPKRQGRTKAELIEAPRGGVAGQDGRSDGLYGHRYWERSRQSGMYPDRTCQSCRVTQVERVPAGQSRKKSDIFRCENRMRGRKTDVVVQGATSEPGVLRHPSRTKQ